MVYIVKNEYKERMRKEFEKRMRKEFDLQRNASRSMIEHERTNFPMQKYTKWLAEQEENNRLLSKMLVEHNFISGQDAICEIGNHIKNSISQHLQNPHNFVIPSVGKIDYNMEGILLIKGITNGEKDIVRNLDLTKTSVILCVCNQKAKYYERCIKFFENQTKGLDFKKVIQEDQKIYIARNMM